MYNAMCLNSCEGNSPAQELLNHSRSPGEARKSPQGLCFVPVRHLPISSTLLSSTALSVCRNTAHTRSILALPSWVIASAQSG